MYSYFDINLYSNTVSNKKFYNVPEFSCLFSRRGREWKSMEKKAVLLWNLHREKNTEIGKQTTKPKKKTLHRW